MFFGRLAKNRPVAPLHLIDRISRMFQVTQRSSERGVQAGKSLTEPVICAGFGERGRVALAGQVWQAGDRCREGPQDSLCSASHYFRCGFTRTESTCSLKLTSMVPVICGI